MFPDFEHRDVAYTFFYFIVIFDQVFMDYARMYFELIPRYAHIC